LITKSRNYNASDVASMTYSTSEMVSDSELVEILQGFLVLTNFLNQEQMDDLLPSLPTSIDIAKNIYWEEARLQETMDSLCDQSPQLY
jgi:hypothetical protein